ncbi:MAG: helix-turn-helix transcriptional regulator [Kyrpidia sp.]|nr:helix-turn-helix transcriptional regulator [Kyrpidia sp.]
MTLARRLKALRKSKRLTQQQLADQLQLNRATYAKYETGSHQPDYEILLRLADFFQVSVDYLLGRTDDPRAPRNTFGTSLRRQAEFPRRLREAREKKGLGIEDLAAAVGLSPVDIANLEQSPSNLPGIGMLNRLANCLGVTVAYLVADVDDPRNPGPPEAWYQPKELLRILEDSEITFDGVPLTEADKQRIKDILTGLFWETKQISRRRGNRCLFHPHPPENEM